MCSFKSIYFVIFVLNLYKTNAQISDKRLCVDPDCKEPVSLAKTLLRYSSPGPGLLSFVPNQQITVFSKEAGSLTHLWGVEINGKRGYVPKNLVREYKLIKKPTLLVDTELQQKSQVPLDKNTGRVDPNVVQESYDVIDGTTLYLNPQDGISPSSTESPVLSTAAAPSSDEVGEETEALKSGESLKEKGGTASEPEKESVVDNVLSTISNWMKDDPTSEETDEAEDDEDDDEEEDEDDIEDLDETIDLSDTKEQSQKEYILQKPGDLNSLHNLPPGISASSYSLQTDSKEDSAKVEIAPQETLAKVDDGPTKETEAIPAVKNEPTVPQSDQKPVSKAESTLGVSSSLPPPYVTGTKSPIYDEEQDKSANASEESPTNVKTEPDGTKKDLKDDLVAVETEEAEAVPVLDEATPLPSIIDPVPPSHHQAIEENGSQKVPPVAVEQSGSSESSTPSNSPLEMLKPLMVDSVQNQPRKEPETTGGSSVPPAFSGYNSDQNEISSEVKNSGNSNEENFNLEDKKEDNLNGEPHEKSEDSGVSTEDTLDGRNLTSDMTPNEEQTKEVADFTEDDSLKGDLQNVSEDTEFKGIEGSNEDVNVDLDDIKFEDPKEDVGGKEEGGGGEDATEEEVGGGEIATEEEVGGDEDAIEEEGGGLFSSILSLFGGGSDESESRPKEDTLGENVPQSKESVIDYCDVNIEKCNTSKEKDFPDQKGLLEDIELSFNSDIFIYLLTTSVSVIVFLFGYMFLDRNRREAPLVSRINKLEKELLVMLKENELLQEKGSGFAVPETAEVVEQLKQHLTEVQLVKEALEAKVTQLERELEEKEGLEDQIESLEKELETSTEVGMELNRIISEMLDPTNGSDKLKENVEQLQRQLLEQKDTINTISTRLKEKEAENHMVQLEWEKGKRKCAELQSKLEEMADKVVQIEKEKEQQQGTLQNEIAIYHQKFNEAVGKVDVLNNEIQILRGQLAEVQRQADIKAKEYKTLQESLEKIKSLKNDRDALKSLLDATAIRAELQQLRSDNEKYVAQLQHEESLKAIYEKKYQAVSEEVNLLHQKYEQADKEKVEANSRLEVLNNYFKKREAELQEEVIKYKSIWEAKEGEATSTTERIKYIQEEIENYKAQNETLKQEIISQEIDLKSQISMLEKKVHENWVTARQTERKLEDAKQEAAQLRNRLTLRERTHNRLQSPMDQNGELTLSPHPIDSPASPPLLYSGRDHITKSPPIPGLPPFLPPPPGAPFMPPPLHGMPPFMPPPPNMFPGDHRPPPLGRMSSPPLNSRYSPDTSAFSPYDRNSPSPPYDSEYGTSPPPIRGYSPYNSRDDRRDYKRPPHVRTNGRNVKGSVISSGSEHSNDSLDKINRKQSKMV